MVCTDYQQTALAEKNNNKLKISYISMVHRLTSEIFITILFEIGIDRYSGKKDLFEIVRTYNLKTTDSVSLSLIMRIIFMLHIK